MTERNGTYQPVIIIGAGRSGTNILRDVLTQIPGSGTWNCDEINYIWRHGNARYPCDEFNVNLATKSVKRYIRRAFSRLAQSLGVRYVVEKTCANSLRVAFVASVFPEAKFIFIVRDGRDVIASAMKRWVAPLDIPYLLKKARHLPLTDAPFYGARYLYNRMYRLFSGEKRLAFWGPRFEGVEEVLRSRTLAEVCAMQWVRCVESSEHDLDQLDASRVRRLRYEEFVTNPSGELKALARFLDTHISRNDLRKSIQRVSSKSVGNWKTRVEPETMEVIEPLIRASMKRYGYMQ